MLPPEQTWDSSQSPGYFCRDYKHLVPMGPSDMTTCTAILARHFLDSLCGRSLSSFPAFAAQTSSLSRGAEKRP
jgi:hypothetical protein